MVARCKSRGYIPMTKNQLMQSTSGKSEVQLQMFKGALGNSHNLLIYMWVFWGWGGGRGSLKLDWTQRFKTLIQSAMFPRTNGWGSNVCRVCTACIALHAAGYLYLYELVLGTWTRVLYQNVFSFHCILIKIISTCIPYTQIMTK